MSPTQMPIKSKRISADCGNRNVFDTAFVENADICVRGMDFNLAGQFTFQKSLPRRRLWSLGRDGETRDAEIQCQACHGRRRWRHRISPTAKSGQGRKCRGRNDRLPLLTGVISRSRRTHISATSQSLNIGAFCVTLALKPHPPTPPPLAFWSLLYVPAL